MKYRDMQSETDILPVKTFLFYQEILIFYPAVATPLSLLLHGSQATLEYDDVGLNWFYWLC